MNRQNTGDFYSSETILCDTMMANTRHHTFVTIYRMDDTKSDPNVHCERWVTGGVGVGVRSLNMPLSCRMLAAAEDVHLCKGSQGPVLPAQFWHESETALK